MATEIDARASFREQELSARPYATRVSMFLDEALAAGLLAALVFTTLAFGAVEPWSVALFEMIVIALLLLWGIKITMERQVSIAIPPTALPLAAMLLLGMAQSVAFANRAGQRMSLSVDVEATRHAVTILFFLAISFVLAVNFVVKRERLIVLANALTLFGTCLAAFALIQHFTWDGRFYWLRSTSHDVFGPFVNRNHFAGYMAMLAPVPLGLILTVVRGHARLLYGFAGALMGTAAIVSGSRSGVASLCAALVFVAISHRRHRRRAEPLRAWGIGPLAVVAIAMIAGVIWIGAVPIVERFGQAADALLRSGTPDVARATIWRDTLEMIRDYPVLGAGLGSFRTIYPRYAETQNLFGLDYAHNDYLQVAADAGAVGGIIAVWFIAALFVAIYRGIRSDDRLVAGLSLAAGAGIVGVLVQSLSDTDLQIPSNALLFLILSAMVAHPALPISESGRCRRRSSKGRSERNLSRSDPHSALAHAFPEGEALQKPFQKEQS